jgi:hypothetical protein
MNGQCGAIDREGPEYGMSERGRQDGSSNAIMTTAVTIIASTTALRTSPGV